MGVRGRAGMVASTVVAACLGACGFVGNDQATARQRPTPEADVVTTDPLDTVAPSAPETLLPPTTVTVPPTTTTTQPPPTYERTALDPADAPVCLAASGNDEINDNLLALGPLESYGRALDLYLRNLRVIAEAAPPDLAPSADAIVATYEQELARVGEADDAASLAAAIQAVRLNDVFTSDEAAALGDWLDSICPPA